MSRIMSYSFGFPYTAPCNLASGTFLKLVELCWSLNYVITLDFEKKKVIESHA